jgi:hypothetical protein
MNAKSLNKLRYHLDRLVRGEAREPEDDWARLAQLVREVLEAPTPADGVELRRRLADFERRIDERRLPDDAFGLNRELERVAKSGAHRPAPADAPRTPAAEVAVLVRGRALLVIGGDPRPEHAERLRAAFELAAVHWPPTSKVNPSVTGLEPWVARPEVALVLLLIRFVRHGVNWELPAVCERYAKPLVRVPSGYNAETVAPLILEQAGKRLSGA